MPIDMSAAKVPPKKRTANTKTQTVEVKPVASERERREEGLNGLGQLVQGGLLVAKQYADAAAIGMHFGNVSSELAKLAENNDSIAKPIDFLIQVGPYGALIQAVMPLAMQLLANHKIIDAANMPGSGIVTPEVLESQMQAQMAQIALQARLEEREVKRQMADLERQWQEMEAEDKASNE